MPVLEWIGKSKVVNHHRDVPYHVLEKKYTFDAAGVHAEGGADDGNMIIHGDNLVALKSLLPQYEGRVDCIYIVPCSDLRARLLSLPCISSQICTRTAC
ncbi:MAG: hypothetical protein MR711_00825 [Selenomonas sp.]|uniref:hypothetical protein n=1 Tax=Selenomonas sp. TaxID=2053611 RepID=UPI0025E1B1AC|nr:hypothetical protein [Selenomonas sp.]MCI6084794.1 hypothetical protein [Selenomonas sp.]